jgi:TonB family protein
VPLALAASLLLHAAVVGGGILALGLGSEEAPEEHAVHLVFDASAAEQESEAEETELLLQESSPEPLPMIEEVDLVPVEEVPEEETLPDLVPLEQEPTPAPTDSPWPSAPGLRTRATLPPPAPRPVDRPKVSHAPPRPPRPAASAPAALRPLHMPRISADTYPSQALLQGIQGTVIVELTVAADGRVSSVTLVRSSGHAVLDADALQRAREFLFRPIGKVTRAHVPLHYRIY